LTKLGGVVLPLAPKQFEIARMSALIGRPDHSHAGLDRRF